MNKGTNIFIGERDLKDNGMSAGIHVDGKQIWVPARPVGYIGFWHTFKCAWKVLRGKADILIWKYQ